MNVRLVFIRLARGRGWCLRVHIMSRKWRWARNNSSTARWLNKGKINWTTNNAARNSLIRSVYSKIRSSCSSSNHNSKILAKARARLVPRLLLLIWMQAPPKTVSSQWLHQVVAAIQWWRRHLLAKPVISNSRHTNHKWATRKRCMISWWLTRYATWYVWIAKSKSWCAWSASIRLRRQGSSIFSRANCFSSRARKMASKKRNCLRLIAARIWWPRTSIRSSKSPCPEMWRWIWTCWATISSLHCMRRALSAMRV